MIKIQSRLRTETLEIEQGHFPDNTLHLKVNKNHFGGKQPIIYVWDYENDAELFTLICLRKHFNAPEHILEIAYCPHARMDRVKSDSDVFTLKYFCDTINMLNFDEVRVLDVHSSVAPALLNNCKNIEPTENILQVVEKVNPDLFFYPDEGAMKRYSTLVPGPYAFGIKHRNWDDGKITGLQIANKDAVKGKNILIIDDICSRGGTFYHSARALKEAGAEKIYLYVSHLEKTVLDGELWDEMCEGKLVDHIYTANPLFNIYDSDLITVV